MTELLIEASGLHAYYGASHILRGVDFAVARGETIGLMGRNGMGKTTLLKTLMGLVPPRAGSVRVMGRDRAAAVRGRATGRGLRARRARDLRQPERHREPQDGGPPWPARQPWRRLDLRARAEETFPRLKERLGHGGQQLSGGEQQMLTIGRALMTNPDVLILDEATEGLAPLIAREIWRICELIRAGGISSVVVDKNWKHRRGSRTAT